MEKGGASAEETGRQGKLVLIVGLAGAGYTTALKTLQDKGYLAVDNLPMALLSQLVSLEIEAAGKKVAVSIDGRTSGFDASRFEGLMADLRGRLGDRVGMVYLSASRDELFRRFNATRRHHPLSVGGTAEGLTEALELDWQRMEPLNTLADTRIDTTSASPAELRQALFEAIGEVATQPIPIQVQSFSYRKGIPADADLVLDMRFITNPHWNAELAAKTGLDKEVQAFILDDPAFKEGIANLGDFLALALPRYSSEGRPHFYIATGCTGGRHRSVFAALELARMLEGMGHPVSVRHRDIA